MLPHLLADYLTPANDTLAYVLRDVRHEDSSAINATRLLVHSPPTGLLPPGGGANHYFGLG